MPIFTNNGSLIFDLCDVLKENENFQDKTWFILLDEFENLDVLQQKIINTLIKANQPPVIFKLAIRPGGWWTQETLSSTESLEVIADYELIDYQNDFTEEDYKDLVVQAFKKSLALNNIKQTDFLDVRNFLPELPPEEEAYGISQRSSRTPNYAERISKFIDAFTTNEERRESLKSTLILNHEPLRTRLHLVLLDRGESPDTIAKEINNKSKKYKEWYKHNRIGTLFVFCSDYKIKKNFSGFETFILLSSKIMRNFVSLFSRAWEISLDEGFTADAPTAFSFDTQSKAAHDVSRSKVFEIQSYATIGQPLWSFANYLGRIFEQLNKDGRQSQPERNHFGIIGEVADNKAQDLFRGALLNSVLQEAPPTKMRSDVVRSKDILLNRIYCPFYNMSYRKMHKLELNSADFQFLISGSDEEKKQTSNKILKNCLKDQSIDSIPSQLSFADSLIVGGSDE